MRMEMWDSEAVEKHIDVDSEIYTAAEKKRVINFNKTSSVIPKCFITISKF